MINKLNKFNLNFKFILIFILITLIGLIAYRKALDNFFYSEDLWHIAEAQSLHMFKLSQLWKNIIAIIHSCYGSVSFIYYLINNLLESIFGTNPFLYHLHNILLHILNAMLVFAILYRFVGSFKISSLACLFFLLNPLHVEAIYYRAGDHSLYVSLFILLTLFCYIHSFYKSSLLFLFLAMCTKPDASGLLLYIILVEVCLFDNKANKELRKRLKYPTLIAFFLFIIYVITYTHIPQEAIAYGFNFSVNSLGQIFKNFSFLLFPFKKLYYLAIPVLFSLSYLNLSKEEKRKLLFSVSFIFLSILPYQLFKNPPTAFYFYDFKDSHNLYIPAIGQAFLIASILKILIFRLNSLKRIPIYACAGLVLFLNLRAISNLDGLFEENEYLCETLIKGVMPYFKKNPDKFFILFNFPSLADPGIPYYYVNSSVWYPISAIFFDYKLISVTELELLPYYRVWIKEKYPTLPALDDTVMLKFEEGIIRPISPKDKALYYKYFVNEAKLLYAN